jgi:hypothetical protein
MAASSSSHAGRPSLTSRLSFAASVLERGESRRAGGADAIEEEEIAEIKRYEVRPSAV